MLIQNIQNSSGLILPFKSYEPEKNLSNFGIKWKTSPKYLTIFISENLAVDVSSFYIQKCGILHFLPERSQKRKITDAC